MSDFKQHLQRFMLSLLLIQFAMLNYFQTHKTHRPVRRAKIFSLEILGKNNDERMLILVIYWKKTGLLHTKISNHNIIYSS
jgi:hypothetical protein